jgi:putative GTP pyrophosphokinase
MSSLEDLYRERLSRALTPLAHNLQTYIEQHFAGVERIDRISVRTKSVSRFLGKAAKRLEEGSQKYNDPLYQIQDQIGARIVTFYKCDVARLSEIVERYFTHIEAKEIVPDSESEFGYFGKHFILFLPEDVFDDSVERDKAPKFFELQVKTLFQHAWGEAEHDLGYKPDRELTTEDRRRIAFVSAQAWGADEIFNELFEESLSAN